MNRIFPLQREPWRAGAIRAGPPRLSKQRDLLSSEFARLLGCKQRRLVRQAGAGCPISVNMRRNDGNAECYEVLRKKLAGMRPPVVSTVPLGPALGSRGPKTPELQACSSRIGARAALCAILSPARAPPVNPSGLALGALQGPFAGLGAAEGVIPPLILRVWVVKHEHPTRKRSNERRSEQGR